MIDAQVGGRRLNESVTPLVSAKKAGRDRAACMRAEVTGQQTRHQDSGCVRFVFGTRPLRRASDQMKGFADTQ